MESFNHVLNWKLRRGSHLFPGKDGGTCITEAAVVAAGFDYQPIRSVEKMPKCFSRPICRLAMLLNDIASDEDRQRLLPFVTRLACADTPEIERIRADFITQNLRYGYPISRFERGLKVLEGALAIGRPAEPFPSGKVTARMDAARARAVTPTSAPDTPWFAKLKKWVVTEGAELTG